MKALAGLGKRAIAACEGPKALTALFVVSAMESSFFPVPIDMAMIPIGIAQRSRMWLVVLVGTVGSVFGAALGYAVGALLYASIGGWLVSIYGLEAELSDFRYMFLANGGLALLIAALSPIPYKLAAIASGSMGMSLPFFIVATFAVRLIRFSLIGLVVFLFGSRLMVAFESRFGLVGGLLLLTMIGGILITPVLF